MKKQEVIDRYGIEEYNRQLELSRKWKQNHKSHLSNYETLYNKTQKGRAYYLISGYSREDKKRNRGVCTLTKDQLIQLWNNGCYYCGETDWRKLGADRIDNSKPHTLENCVCCCKKCNDRKQANSIKKAVQQFTKDGVFIAEYESITDAAKTDSQRKHISECCNGKRKTCGGFVWTYAA